MDKIQPEIRCVGKGGVKFIPKNLVDKPGFLTKHGLEVEDLATSAITSFHKSVVTDEDLLKQKEAEELAKLEAERIAQEKAEAKAKAEAEKQAKKDAANTDKK